MPFNFNLKALYSNDFRLTLHDDTISIGAIIKLTNLNGALDAPKRAS